ncbi:MAG: hypothetical protein NVS4B3_25260 [Gemmatimonadaceae bacterium]
MPRFMVTRTLPPMTPDQLQTVARNVVRACDEVGNMRWIRSHLTADGKHSFCEMEAPNSEACRRHASIAGLPVDQVTPLGGEIGPSTYS